MASAFITFIDFTVFFSRKSLEVTRGRAPSTSSKKKKSEEKDKKKGKGLSLFGKKKAKVEDVLMFSKQFATMVKAGLPILQVLGMLRDQIESPAMKDVIEDIRKSLEGGVTLLKCFEKYPELFDNIYVNLIKAGEASGKLDIFLLKIVESLEKKENIKFYYQQL